MKAMVWTKYGTPDLLQLKEVEKPSPNGEIGVELTQIGYPLDKKTGYGMWEWGIR